MTGQETVRAQKRRGPAPTGKGLPVVVRLQPELLRALDAWIAAEAAQGREVGRPEALRRLAADALGRVGLPTG